MPGYVSWRNRWRPTVKIGTAARQNARVRVWDFDGDSAVNLLTDANGQIAEQILVDTLYDITLTDTVGQDQETPHKVRTLYIGDTDLDSPNGKYGTVANEFTKDLDQVASLNTIFLRIDQFITHTATAIAAYTGIAFTHASFLITMSTAHTILEIYEACAKENYDNPQEATTAFLETVDGANFQAAYNLTVNGVTLTCTTTTLNMAASRVVTFQGAGNFSGTLTVNGNVVWGTELTINNLKCDSIDFTVAGTYTVNNCDFGDVTNSSGGAVIINATNSNMPGTPTGPNVTINSGVPVTVKVVDDSDGSNIVGAHVLLLLDSDKSTQVLNGSTDAQGEVSTSFDYLSDTDVVGWARQWDLVGDDYTPKNIGGTITGSGLSLTVRLVPI